MEEYEYEEEFVEYDPVNGPIEAVESGSNTESEEEFVEYDPAGEDYDPVNDRMGHVVAVWRDLTSSAWRNPGLQIAKRSARPAPRVPALEYFIWA